MPDLHEQFDWRDRKTWRALCALAAMVGSVFAMAALLSEFLVSDLFALPLGRDDRYWPDAAAAAFALFIVLTIFWLRIRFLGLSTVRAHFREAGHARGAKGGGNLTMWGVVIVWTVLILAVYFLLFFSVKIAFGLEGPGHFTTLMVVVVSALIAQFLLITGLERFGARRKPPHPMAG